MLPTSTKGGKRKQKEVWLPVWGWVEADWGTFNFNAEWQGPIPGMTKCAPESSASVGRFALIAGRPPAQGKARVVHAQG